MKYTKSGQKEKKEIWKYETLVVSVTFCSSWRVYSVLYYGGLSLGVLTQTEQASQKKKKTNKQSKPAENANRKQRQFNTVENESNLCKKDALPSSVEINCAYEAS